MASVSINKVVPRVLSNSKNARRTSKQYKKLRLTSGRSLSSPILYTLWTRMERMGKKKDLPALPLGDICDPFTYNYYQHLTNFDVLKVFI